MSKPEPSDPTRVSPVLSEVRYSLPQMLRELEVERATGSFAMEKLGQTEIGKLFKAKAPLRRVKSKS
jgi:hypothetical protein